MLGALPLAARPLAQSADELTGSGIVPDNLVAAATAGRARLRGSPAWSGPTLAELARDQDEDELLEIVAALAAAGVFDAGSGLPGARLRGSPAWSSPTLAELARDQDEDELLEIVAALAAAGVFDAVSGLPGPRRV